MQHTACGLQSNRGGSLWKRPGNDTGSFTQAATKNGGRPIGLASITTECAQTVAAESRRRWTRLEKTQRDPHPRLPRRLP